MVKADTPRRRASDYSHRWDSVAKIVQVVGAVFLALIAYWTKVSGDNAQAAAVAAKETAEVVATATAQSDSTLGTIHRLVDGTKSRLDTLVFGLQEDNTALRLQLRKHGITPREPEPKVNP